MVLEFRLFVSVRGFARQCAIQAGYAGFERLNVILKQLITDWQTIAVSGERFPNDHSDKEYDAKIHRPAGRTS